MKKLFFIISLFSIADMFGMEESQNIQEEVAETSAIPENLSVLLQHKETREALKTVDPQALQAAIQEAEYVERSKQRERQRKKQAADREFSEAMLKRTKQAHKGIEQEIRNLRFTSQTTIDNILELSRVAPEEGLKESDRLSQEIKNMNEHYSKMPSCCKSLGHNVGNFLGFISSGLH